MGQISVEIMRLPGSLLSGNQHDGELGSAVDADEEKELALGRLHFRDVDVKEPNGVALELLPLGSVATDIRKTRDPMTLQAAMQR